MKTMEEIKLITIHGDEIIIEVDKENFEEVKDEMLVNLDSNTLYFVGDYGAIARYHGYQLTVIDMKKVIGRE